MRGSAAAFCLVLASAAIASEESARWVERGKAWLEAGRSADALLCFSNAVTCDPNDADAVGWYGVALARVAETAEDREEAMARLAEARTKGCTLPEVSRAIARIHLVEGRAEQALAALDEYEKARPGDPAALEWRGIASTRREVAAPRAWACWQRVFGGFDTNAIALGDDTQIAFAGDRRKATWHWGVAAGGSYRIDLGRGLDLRLAAHGARTVYDNLARANTDEAAVSVTAGWRASERVAAHLEASLDHTEFGYDPFQTGLAVSPSVTVREFDWLTGRVEYRYLTREISQAFVSALDPDGHTHTVSVRQSARVPGCDLRLDLAYSHVWSVTEGSEYDYDSDSVSLAATHPIVWGIEGTTRAGYTAADYDQPSALDPAGEERDDDVVTLQLVLRRSFGEHWTVYLSGTMVDHESDADVYDYDRNLWGWGVEHRF